MADCRTLLTEQGSDLYGALRCPHTAVFNFLEALYLVCTHVLDTLINETGVLLWLNFAW